MKKCIFILTLTLLFLLTSCGGEDYILVIDPPISSEQATDAAPAPEAPAETASEPPAEAASTPAAQTDDTRPNSRVTFAAVGDNLVHNTVLAYGLQEDGTYDYKEIYCQINDYISSFDLAAINQESPLVTDPSDYSSYPEFGTPTAMGDALAAEGFDIVTMATNHMCDKGDRGILQSVEFWKTQHPEVALLGIHDSQEDSDTVTVVEKNGIKIALLNYTYGFNGGGPSESWMCDTLSSEAELAEDMEKAESAADCTIVFVHAGTEYQHTNDSSQYRWFTFLAEHGADAIIGTHPHVLQPMEIYTTADGREVPFYWSLGNFVSHQLETDRWLGGLASFDIVLRDGVCTIEDAELEPTFTLIWYEGDTACFRATLLENVTDEMIEGTYYQHYYGNVAALWELYNSIVN